MIAGTSFMEKVRIISESLLSRRIYLFQKPSLTSGLKNKQTNKTRTSIFRVMAGLFLFSEEFQPGNVLTDGSFARRNKKCNLRTVKVTEYRIYIVMYNLKGSLLVRLRRSDFAKKT